MKGSEISKWDEIPERERQDSLYNFTEIRSEKIITPEYRQLSFDNWDVTDDHGMHIVGVAQDQKGNRYYYTKNSWNDDSNKFKGYLYMSVPFVKWATTSIMVHKNAIPADIKAKLGL
jgi:bleomycin hydrolase